MRMESDEFDFMAPAYVRGFLKSYAKFLRVNTEPLLKEFDRLYGGERAETAQIAALDRRSKRHAPRERRKLNSWAVAAAVAAGALLLLAIVGLLAPSEDEEPGSDIVAAETPSPSPEYTEDDSPSPDESPSEDISPSPTDSLGLDEGLDVEIIASIDRCWVSVTADGVQIPAETLELGDSQTFTAEEEMIVTLGNAQGVELIVNGENIGTPGSGVQEIRLPDDVDTL